MNKTVTMIFAGLGVASAGAIAYMLLRRKKDDGSQTDNASSPVAKKQEPVKSVVTLKDIRVTTAPTQYIIKDRQKFFDEWAAEEGGVQSIKDMYAKKPSSFSQADIYYLQSRGILPKTEIKGRGLI